MVEIKGDIDLTQNLDFYRKKPKKLLPANVNLSRPITKDRLVVNNLSLTNYEFTIHHGTYSDYVTYNTYDNGTTISISNSDWGNTWESIYHNDISSISNSSTNSSIVVSATEPNGTVISSATYSIKLNYSNYSYSNTLKKISEKLFSLWKHVEKKFMEKDSIKVVSCSNCGIMYITTENSKGYHLCKECNRLESALDKMMNCMDGYGFIRKPERAYYGRVPWDNDNPYDKRNRVSFSGRGSSNRPIPWLRHLNHRIYEDYMDELEGEEKNYDSYLTNMGWIGVRQNRHDEIDQEDELETITIEEVRDYVEPTSIVNDNRLNTVVDEVDTYINSSFSNTDDENLYWIV